MVIGEYVLKAEAALGKVLGAIPKKGNKEYGSQGGTIPSLPPDIDKKTSHYAQQLARHPEAIKQAVALALKLGEMIQAQKETVGLNRGGRPTKKLGQAVTRFPVPPLLPRASTSTAGLPHASSCWEEVMRPSTGSFPQRG
jgi:hypothetical protein